MSLSMPIFIVCQRQIQAFSLHAHVAMTVVIRMGCKYSDFWGRNSSVCLKNVVYLQKSLLLTFKNERNMKAFPAKPWLLPQPVLLIGTYDKDGKPNAMNAAWGGTWDNHEIAISLSHHATTDNLDLQGEFTITFATAETLVAADYVGIVSAKKDPEKIQKTGWAFEKAEHVNAPVFKDFPLTLECKVKETLNRSDTGYMLIGEIVGILANEAYLGEDGQPDVAKMNLITYDPVHYNYIQLGQPVGHAFADGKKLK